MSIMPATRLCHLQRATVQAYLDDMAAIAARYGIVVESGCLAPRNRDTGGYLLLPRGGHLRTYAIDSKRARFLEEKPFGKRCRSTMTADISRITAHELIRRLRPIYAGSSSHPTE